MKKVLIALLIPLIVPLVARAQKNRFTSTFLGLSIDTPVHWFRIDKVDIRAVNDSSYSRELLNKVFAQGDNAVTFLELSKHPVNRAELATPAPMIGITVQRTNATSLMALAFSLKKDIDNANEAFKLLPVRDSIQGFSYEMPFTTYSTNGMRGLKAILTSPYPEHGIEVSIHIHLYVFLRDGYYVKIAMIDTSNEDETDLFNSIAQSIQFR